MGQWLYKPRKKKRGKKAIAVVVLLMPSPEETKLGSVFPTLAK